MVAERQDRYPNGTYRLQISIDATNVTAYRLTNLVTRRCYSGNSLWNMLHSLDSDLSENPFPQKTVQYRSWEVKRRMKDINGHETSAEPVAGSPIFVIRVLFRQNATWQGSIQWLEGKQTRHYRSEYEMLKLMDEAMQMSAAEGDNTRSSWDSK